MKLQCTLKTPVYFSGVGIHSGQVMNATLMPAAPNTGIRFVRTDLPGSPEIPADIDHVVSTERSTKLAIGETSITTVEHLLGLCYGMGIDNLEIHIDGPEIPIFDGSALPLVEKVRESGIVEQDAPRVFFDIPHNLKLEDSERGSYISAWPDDHFRLEVTVDFNSRSVPTQAAFMNPNTDFEKDIAPARTFAFLHELEWLVRHGLIKGGSLENALVFVEEKPSAEKLSELSGLFGDSEVLINGNSLLGGNELRFPNEPARHKLLDFLGDLALTGVKVRGHIAAFRPGHSVNIAFAKRIKQIIKDEKAGKVMPPVDMSKTVYDVNDIMRMLPHRYPFLLVDKIVEMTENYVVGVKNVTMNEPFFQGHFPGNPVMPGVLQIEAMAQAGGILVMGNLTDPQNYTPYFIKIDNVKFKQKVVPGDTLVFWLQLKSPIRRGICHMEGRAFVDGKLVMEGEMMAQIVRNQLEGDAH
jgi:UDP-3-O-[3-hydroxymyristoyl] N-acetylglucosamine deacetylase/3-hydroxyacyl-[acyl-carrier-protein] dehydratase